VKLANIYLGGFTHHEKANGKKILLPEIYI